MATKKIAVLVGSLRKDSFNRRIAKVAMALAPASLAMDMIDISQLPLYNQDDDEGGAVPPAWSTFRQSMKPYDGVLFVTPEYNRSLPGVLKNAIDVGSRPYGSSIWGGKAGAVISVSPGAIGGFGANHHLRQTMVFLDVPCMQQPEVYIGNAAKLFDADGNLTNDNTKHLLQKFMAAFAHWVDSKAVPA